MHDVVTTEKVTTDCQIINGDCLDVLKTLDAESVQCCVTSPPYFGLRDYGSDGQIGLEPTPAAFVAKMVEVFEEVRRVLRKDGTLWLNLGDSYAGSGKGLYSDGNCYLSDKSKKQKTNVGSIGVKMGTVEGDAGHTHGVKPPEGFKAKDLIGIPWRVAFALQEAGWWLRQDIIWHKPNPMPESVTDRCTKSHEYIFLLTKSAKYYYNADAIKERLADSSISRLSQDVENQIGSDRVPGKTNGNMKAVGSKNVAEKGQTPNSFHLSRLNGTPDKIYETRNKRSVWTVTTKPYKEAHFATFPPKLIEPCILAGSKEGDTVLDPFFGAGTTGLVSLKHRRKVIGIELNPEYVAIAEARCKQLQVKLF